MKIYLHFDAREKEDDYTWIFRTDDSSSLSLSLLKQGFVDAYKARKSKVLSPHDIQLYDDKGKLTEERVQSLSHLDDIFVTLFSPPPSSPSPSSSPPSPTSSPSPSPSPSPSSPTSFSSPAEHKNLGNDLLKKGMYQKAIHEYTQGVQQIEKEEKRKKKEENNLLLAILLSNRSEAYLRLKQYAEVERDTRAVLKMEKNPQHLKCYFRRGKALIYLKRYQEAEKCFLDGISCLTPDSSPSLRREFESWAKKAKKDGEASPATSSSSPSPSPSPSSSSSSSTSSSTTPSSSKGAGPSSFVGSEAWEVPQGEVDQLLQFVAKGDEYIQQKNYRAARAVFEQFLQVCPSANDCTLKLAYIYKDAKRYGDAVRRLDSYLTFDPNHFGALFMFGEILYEKKRYEDSLEIFYRILKIHEKSDDIKDTFEFRMVQVYVAKCLIRTGEKGAGGKMIQAIIKGETGKKEVGEVYVEALLEYGILLREQGDVSEALRVFFHLLIRKTDCKPAKRAIARTLQDGKHLSNLKNDILKPEDILEGMERGGKGGREKKKETQLETAQAPALAYVAVTIKEFGAVESAAKLYGEATEMEPGSFTYILNYAHTLETLGNYGAALDKLLYYLSLNLDFSLSRSSSVSVSCREVMEIVRVLREREGEEKERKGEEGEGEGKEGFGEMRMDRVAHAKDCLVLHSKESEENKFSSQELDFLGVLYALVKMLYLTSHLSLLPPLIRLIEKVRVGVELHKTNIRNENAYFSCIAQLMDYAYPPLSSSSSSSSSSLSSPLSLSSLPSSSPLSPSSKENLSSNLSLLSLPKTTPLSLLSPSLSLPGIVVVGDSHSLSYGWQQIDLWGQKRVLLPLLVTGLKIWHLREESEFFTKVNFLKIMEKLPKKSCIISLIGEIDCRESFLISLERCRYDSIGEAAGVTIRIYLNIWKKMIQQKQFRVFVHPVLPVLPQTRKIVEIFNKILKEAIEKEKIPSLFYLDFFPQLITSPEKKEKKKGKQKQKEKEKETEWSSENDFRSEFALDGTHVNPSVVSLLEQSLSSFPPPS